MKTTKKEDLGLLKVTFNEKVAGSEFAYKAGDTAELLPEDAKKAVELGLVK